MGDAISGDRDAAGGVTSARAVLAEIQALRDRGQVSLAIDRCRERVRADPDSVELLLTLARLELDHGDPGNAIDALGNAARIAPDRFDVWVALGDGCLAGQRFQRAVGAYRRAMRIDPSPPGLAARLGAALQSAGNVEEAVSCYRTALERDPGNALLHYNLGTALKRLHRFEEAVVEYRDAVRLAPGNPELEMRLGNLLVETSRFQEAIEPLNSALGDLPPSARPFVYHLLSYAHKKLGQGEASVESAKQLVELTGGGVSALMHLSAAYLTLGNAEEALATCERGLERQPASRQLLSDKAIALAALGRREEASRLMDFERLLHVSRADAVAGYENVDEFNAALIEHIKTHPSLDFSGISLSCHKGATSDELLVDPKGPVGDLEVIIKRSAENFRARLYSESSHPWIGNLPSQERLELSAWVTRLRSQGFQHGHIHPTAWISGVYYLSLPPGVGAGNGDQSGWIEFGRPPYYYACTEGHDIRSIQPHEGMLVLFPSYFYHRTIPFDDGNERITIAFDFRLPAKEAPEAKEY